MKGIILNSINNFWNITLPLHYWGFTEARPEILHTRLPVPTLHTRLSAKALWCTPIHVSCWWRGLKYTEVMGFSFGVLFESVVFGWNHLISGNQTDPIIQISHQTSKASTHCQTWDSIKPVISSLACNHHPTTVQPLIGSLTMTFSLKNAHFRIGVNFILPIKKELNSCVKV